MSSNNSLQRSAPNTLGQPRVAVHKALVHHIKRAFHSRLGNRLRRGIEAGVSRVPLPRPTHTHVIDEVRRINAANSDDAVWAGLPDSLRRVTGFELALVLRFDESAEFSVVGCSPATRLASVHGQHDSRPIDFAEAGLAALHGSAIALHGHAGPVGVPGWARASGCHSGIVAPITGAHHVVGVVYVVDNGLNPPTYTDIERVERVLHAASRRLVKHARLPGQSVSKPRDEHVEYGGEANNRGRSEVRTTTDDRPVTTTRPTSNSVANLPSRPGMLASAVGQRPIDPTRVTLQARFVERPPRAIAPIAAAMPTGRVQPVARNVAEILPDVRSTRPIAAVPLAQTAAAPRAVHEPTKTAGPQEEARAARRVDISGSPAAVTKPAVGDDSRSKLILPGITLDRASERVVINGVRVALSGTEFSLLYALALTYGDVVSARDLTSICWGTNGPGTNTFDVTMHRLRRRLANAPGGEGIIQTVRGQGYVLLSPKVKAGAAA